MIRLSTVVNGSYSARMLLTGGMLQVTAGLCQLLGAGNRVHSYKVYTKHQGSGPQNIWSRVAIQKALSRVWECSDRNAVNFHDRKKAQLLVQERGASAAEGVVAAALCWSSGGTARQEASSLLALSPCELLIWYSYISTPPCSTLTASHGGAVSSCGPPAVWVATGAS